MLESTENDNSRAKAGSNGHQLATLTLNDGSHLTGINVGAPVVTSGELVFTTSMVGYNEALTDPSYYGQILVFSYPLIGNYGIRKLEDELNTVEYEGRRIYPSAVIISRISHNFSHWKAGQNLETWLKTQGVPCLTNVDTRELVKKLGRNSNILARIHSPNSTTKKDLHPNWQQTNSNFFDPNQFNIVQQVSGKDVKTYGEGKYHIGLIDFGTKWNIIRKLVRQNFQVTVIPYHKNFKEYDVDGWVLSNGPGNPEHVSSVFSDVKSIMDSEKPILGICLGCQIMALSQEAKVKKLPFGHRGHNHPAKDLTTNRGYITSQNHGYHIDSRTLKNNYIPWFVNANDESLEGFKHETKAQYAVQFHPEAAGGPHDTSWIFDEFLNQVINYAKKV